VGIRCADHVTPLYPQKLALTSPTGGGRSVGTVRSRTKAMEFSFIILYRSSSHFKLLQKALALVKLKPYVLEMFVASGLRIERFLWFVEDF
jgi:hypothetical protein